MTDSARPPLAQAAAGPAGALVLVIDDSPCFQRALREALEAAAYRVLVADSGEEGLRIMADLRPAAVLVDQMLPGIDGPATVRRIRLDAALSETPCLLFTASEDRDAAVRAFDAGADAFAYKDEGLPAILARLAAMLRPAASAAPARPPDGAVSARKILAVDDSDAYLWMLGNALQGEGYEVMTARSGEEALDLIAVQPVDCVLLDLRMPGLGGHETCRRLKAATVTRDIPIIILTAVDDRTAMLDSLGSGADDYIAKSDDLEALRARVRVQLRRKQFEDDNRRIREQLLRREREAAEEHAARLLAETRAALLDDLERKNRELEAFSYSVSHDLRAPLRAIDGFSRALLEDCAPTLDETGRMYCERVRAGARRMAELIEDLLLLSRVARAEMHRARVDLSDIARRAAHELRKAEPERTTQLVIRDGLLADGDPDLLRIVFDNLLGNAWKFTRAKPWTTIEVGAREVEGRTVFFVRDDGAGFDMACAGKLFAPFQRLHSQSEFPGTGIGLATVYRIVDRHGGRVWAEAEVDKGATFFWTLSPVLRPAPGPPGLVLAAAVPGSTE